MSEIRVKEGESLESALRRFKRSTARSGGGEIIQQLSDDDSTTVGRKGNIYRTINFKQGKK